MLHKDGKGRYEAQKEERRRGIGALYCCTLILTAQKGNMIPRLIRASADWSFPRTMHCASTCILVVLS